MRKKILLGTTTLAMATACIPQAEASNAIKLSLGGKMEQYFGGIKTSKDGGRKAADGLGIDSDTEVYFRGSTTLDNGITVAVNIELEAEAKECCRNADEQYVDVSGNFGKFRLGEKTGVFDGFAVRAPEIAFVDSQDVVSWMKGPNGTKMLDMEPTFDDDAMRLTYMSPSFYGLTFGASYSPNSGVADLGDVRVREGRENSNELQLSLAYDKKIDEVRIVGDTALSTQLDGTDRYAYRAGLGLHWNGWTLAGSYLGTQSERKYRGPAPQGNGTNQIGYRAQIWEAGLAYEVGPYGVEFTYSQNHADADSELGDGQVFRLGGSYIMGPGIRAVTTAFYADTHSTDEKVPDRNGIGFVSGLVLNF